MADPTDSKAGMMVDWRESTEQSLADTKVVLMAAWRELMQVERMVARKVASSAVQWVAPLVDWKVDKLAVERVVRWVTSAALTAGMMAPVLEAS
jgi:hypothetical protein